MKWIFAPLLTLAALFVALLIPPAESQLPQVTVVGPVTAGDCTSFSSTLQLKDSGVVCSASGGTGITAPQFIGTQQGGATGSAFLAQAGGNVGYGWDNTSQGVDQKNWDALAGTLNLSFRAVNDANSSANTWMQVNRGTGTAINNVTFGAFPVIGQGNGTGLNSSFEASALTPAFGWNATGQGTDQKNWDFVANGLNLQGRTVNDASNSVLTWLQVSRGTGTAISNILLGNGIAYAQVTGAGGHIGFTGGTAPTVSACAGFALATGAQDSAGKLTMTSGTTCTFNFGTAYNNPPACVVSPNNALATTLVTTSTTQLAVTFGAAQTAFSWICQGI